MEDKVKQKFVILIGVYIFLEVLGLFLHGTTSLIFWALKMGSFIFLIYVGYVALNNLSKLSHLNNKRQDEVTYLPEQKLLYADQAKFLALQTQINPHFLYNTLEGFRSEALLGGVPSVAKMAELLSKFFRYNISNLEKMVTIEDEIRNINNYFKIQCFRFDERIKMEFIFEDDEEQIKKCRTPKLVLQPIIENSIHHGIEPLLGQGTIIVRFIMYIDRLVIVISDNGIGMTSEEVLYLNKKVKNLDFEEIAEMSNGTGIGVLNVNKRIQLLFGQGYGLFFYSKKGVGTDVEITLPIKEKG